MDQLPVYLLKLSGTLAVLYLFYFLVLRRLTFYSWNRWYLVAYSIAAFFLPLININPLLEQADIHDGEFVQWVPVLHPDALAPNISNSTPGPDNLSRVLFVLLSIGFLVMIILDVALG